MKKYLFFPIFFLLSLPVFSQPFTAYSVVHKVHEIESSVLNEKRTVLVHVPAGYENTSRPFPVVYMLDGHTPHPEMMAGILANQTWGGVMPEMILVSITNTDRTRDMTPTRVERFPTSGGAAKFLDYIEKEVIPLVEKNYRTAPYRIFAGHSFAGLTVAYTLVHRPEMFNGYIAASPYLHWEDNLLIKQAAEKFKDAKLEKTVYFGLGDEPDYEDAWQKFQDVLKQAKGLDYEFRQFKDDNHSSVVLPAYYNGLRKIFDGWVPAPNLTFSQIENHYERLTSRFGYEINIPEETLNTAGYTLLNRNDLDAALKLFRTNVKNYPDSANVYDNLGECLEKMGRKKEAAENYKKAFELATAAGNQFLADTAKANLERVKGN